MKLEISCTRAEADHKQLLNCRTTIDGMANGFDKISKLLSISGNEVRLKILFLLKHWGTYNLLVEYYYM
jgi:hypothetical protein